MTLRNGASGRFDSFFFLPFLLFSCLRYSLDLLFTSLTMEHFSWADNLFLSFFILVGWTGHFMSTFKSKLLILRHV